MSGKGIDFKRMPKGFVRCYKMECTCRERCLRALATTQTRSNEPTLTVVNPDTASGDEHCQLLAPTEPVRIAWGMVAMYKMVPVGIEASLRNTLIGALTYYRFYRMRRGEEPIYPEQQAMICDIFRRYGMRNVPDFDRYTEEIRW